MSGSVKKVGVVRFLGTNCDRDIWQAIETAGMQPEWLWYEERANAADYEAFVLPGGFSYGDYLRSGALAAKAPVMETIKEAAEMGKPVLGICNGFQILCEAGLLPGALVKNSHLKFIDKWCELEYVSASPHWASKNGTPIKKDSRYPIAHGDGCYFVTEPELDELKQNDQIWCRYKDNPNGSVDNIAGVMNKNKNVAGMMPHPERALFDWMGGADGFDFFKSMEAL